MNLGDRVKRVKFIDEKLFRAYQELKAGRSEEQRLAVELEHAIFELKQDPFCGVKIPKSIWPREYVSAYHITNLWKYDLSRGWRLVYTIEGNEVDIKSAKEIKKTIKKQVKKRGGLKATKEKKRGFFFTKNFFST